MGVFLATTGLGSYVGSLLVIIVNSVTSGRGKICTSIQSSSDITSQNDRGYIAHKDCIHLHLLCNLLWF